MMVRIVRDQVELLADHLRQADPDPEFILTHASMIVDLARSMPYDFEPFVMPQAPSLSASDVI
ncbi:MAG: hypothetical protein ACAH95_01685 [Fimbriimonas sp.]